MGGRGRNALALCCVAAALTATGCGSSSKSSSNGDGSSTTAQTTPKATTTPIAEPFKRPPNPGPHPGAKVDHLIVKDVVKGDGTEIQAGDTGVFDFIATNWVTGKPLDSAWGKKKPFSTTIDRGVVIDGWWQGIPGMRVGGRRQLLIPPSLGFTSNPNPTVHDATTFFDVVLRAVIPAQPEGTGQASTGQ